jgi:hypothetical protein
MPCYDGRENDHTDCQRRINEATRAACDLRTILRRGGTESDLCQDTRHWIAVHDEWDARRIAAEDAAGIRERTRREALQKLNLDERRALGL